MANTTEQVDMSRILNGIKEEVKQSYIKTISEGKTDKEKEKIVDNISTFINNINFDIIKDWIPKTTDNLLDKINNDTPIQSYQKDIVKTALTNYIDSNYINEKYKITGLAQNDEFNTLLDTIKQELKKKYIQNKTIQDKIESLNISQLSKNANIRRIHSNFMIKKKIIEDTTIKQSVKDSMLKLREKDAEELKRIIEATVITAGESEKKITVEKGFTKLLKRTRESQSKEEYPLEKLLYFMVKTGAKSADLVNKETKQIKVILEHYQKLKQEEKDFINSKAIELLEIDKRIATDENFKLDPNIVNNLYRMQTNVLQIYMIQAMPNCKKAIKSIFSLFNEKLQATNEILENRIKRELDQIEEDKMKGDELSENATQNAEVVVNTINQSTPTEPSIIDNIKSFLNIENPQVGGGTPEENKKKIEDTMTLLTKLFQIYNSDTMIKIMALLTDKNSILEYIKSVGVDEKYKNLSEFLKLFFVDVTEYAPIINLLKNNYEKVAIEEKIERDTTSYKNLISSSENNNFILIYTLLYFVKRMRLNDLLDNKEISENLVKLIRHIIQNIKLLQDIYYKKLYSDKLDTIYRSLIDSKKRVFTFIRERRDSTLSNPRFQFSIDPKPEAGSIATELPNYLYLKYNNIDGAIYAGDAETKQNDDNQPQLKSIIEKRMGTKKPEYYYFGPFDGVFLKEKAYTENKQVSEETSPKMINMLKAGKDICVIGYGQSGSGKTSTLIALKKPGEAKIYDGILIEMCKRRDFIELFGQIKVTMKNIYVHHGSSATSMNDITKRHYKVSDIEGIMDDKKKLILPKITNEHVPQTEQQNHEYIFNNQDDPELLWKLDRQEKFTIPGNNSGSEIVNTPIGLGEFITKAFEIREVEATPNNPNSSRSHVIVCLTLVPKEGNGTLITDENRYRKFVVCDLAGVENVFQCENIDEILNFDQKYAVSEKYGSFKNPDGSDKLPKETIDFGNMFCEKPQDGGSYSDTESSIQLFSFLEDDKKEIKIFNQLDFMLESEDSETITQLNPFLQSGGQIINPFKPPSGDENLVKYQPYQTLVAEYNTNINEINVNAKFPTSIIETVNTLTSDETIEKAFKLTQIYHNDKNNYINEQLKIINDFNNKNKNTLCSYGAEFIKSFNELQELLGYNNDFKTLDKINKEIKDEDITLTNQTNELNKLFGIEGRSTNYKAPFYGLSPDATIDSVTNKIQELKNGNEQYKDIYITKNENLLYALKNDTSDLNNIKSSIKNSKEAIVQLKKEQTNLQNKIDKLDVNINNQKYYNIFNSKIIEKKLLADIKVYYKYKQAYDNINVELLEEIYKNRLNNQTENSFINSINPNISINLDNISFSNLQINNDLGDIINSQPVTYNLSDTPIEQIKQIESQLKNITATYLSTNWYDSYNNYLEKLKKIFDDTGYSNICPQQTQLGGTNCKPKSDQQICTNNRNKLSDDFIKASKSNIESVTNFTNIQEFYEELNGYIKICKEVIENIFTNNNKTEIIKILNILNKDKQTNKYKISNELKNLPVNQSGNIKITDKDLDDLNIRIAIKLIFAELLVFIIGTLKNVNTDFNNKLCDYSIYKKLQFNCKLRRMEGYMINKSLADMRNDIKDIIKSTIKVGEYLPLFYEKEIFPYCRNINLEDEIITSFYEKPKNIEDGENSLAGIILSTMQTDFNIKSENLNFVIFTVINTTNNGKTNNPPNPPYININNLIYNSRILFNETKLRQELKRIRGLLGDYNFYQQNTIFKNILNAPVDGKTSAQIKDEANDFIELIKANNAATLIGSLESTDILQNVTYDKMVCSYNNNLNHILKRYKGITLRQTNSDKTIDQFNQEMFKIKYLKYKEKYLALKTNMNNKYKF